MPSFGPKLRCKNEDCNVKTHVIYKKCNGILCFEDDSKNCFSDFHTK